MNHVRPILLLTADAPELGMPLALAAQQITENFAAVQEDFRRVLGRTFALKPCLVFRSWDECPWNLWRFYAELESEFQIKPRLSTLDTLYYMQVWHPQPKAVAITGTQMAQPVGRCLDGASCIEDFLNLPKPPEAWLAGKSWKMQCRGRLRHELEHGLGGPHPERIFGAWWDYGRGSGPTPDPEEIATLNMEFLEVT